MWKIFVKTYLHIISFYKVDACYQIKLFFFFFYIFLFFTGIYLCTTFNLHITGINEIEKQQTIWIWRQTQSTLANLGTYFLGILKCSFRPQLVKSLAIVSCFSETEMHDAKLLIINSCCIVTLQGKTGTK